MAVVHSVEELIGNTPLLELTHIEEKENLKAKLYAKLESFNPAGSSKDRVALNMILDAEEKGILKKGGTIIEPTSGNTGIGLSVVSVSRGYHAVIVMPDTMSVERIKLMKAYGADVRLSDGKLGMAGAIKLAEKIHEETPGSLIAGQFENPANPDAHYKTTGPEIYRDLDGNIDFFVAGIGTGGTITGTGRYLKEKISDVKVIGIEPKSSPVITEGKAGTHGIQGIGANFIPDALDLSVVDEVVTVSDEDAFSYGKMIGRTEGVLVGISSGAALYEAVKLAKCPENEGKTIVVLLPDTGDHYLSTTMYD